MFNVGKGSPGRWAKSLEGTLSVVVCGGGRTLLAFPENPDRAAFPRSRDPGRVRSPSRRGANKSPSLGPEDRETDVCALVWVGLSSNSHPRGLLGGPGC